MPVSIDGQWIIALIVFFQVIKTMYKVVGQIECQILLNYQLNPYFLSQMIVSLDILMLKPNR